MGKTKKKGLPEGTPLEDYKTELMKREELKKYAVKLGKQLVEVRADRRNLEIDREKILRNLINTICRKMSLDREVRRIEREIINQDNVNERTMISKENELLDIRYKQVPQICRGKNDLLVSNYESFKDIFSKQDQMLKDRFSLCSDYFRKCLEYEGTFMAAKHDSFCDKMDNINDSNITRILSVTKKFDKWGRTIFNPILEEHKDEMKFLVEAKETFIENLQKQHISETIELLKSFEEIIKYNFTVIKELSDDLLSMKQRKVNAKVEFERIKNKYDDLCDSLEKTDVKMTIIKPVILNLEHTRAAENVYWGKMSSLQKQVSNSKLEIDLLEDFLRKEEECAKKLRGCTIKDLLTMRQLQVKIHLFISEVGNAVDELFAERLRVGKLAFCPEPESLNDSYDLYNRFDCYRQSMVEVVERVLRSNYSGINSMGFPTRGLPKLPQRLPSIERPISAIKNPNILRSSSSRAHSSSSEVVMKSLPKVPLRDTVGHISRFMRVQDVNTTSNIYK